MSVGNMEPNLKNSGSSSSLHILDAFPQEHQYSPASSPNRRGTMDSPSRPYNYWHKTSFKIGKQKPSKTRYLTRSELVGLALSTLVSFLVSLSLVALVYYGGPIVVQKLLDFLRWSIPQASVAESVPAPRSTHSLAKSHTLKVFPNLSPATLKSVYLQKTPILFTDHDESDGNTRFCGVHLVEQLSPLGDRSISLYPMRYFQRIKREDGSNISSLPLSSLISPSVSLDLSSIDDQSLFAVDNEIAQEVNLNTLVDATLLSIFDGEQSISIGRGSQPSLSSTPFHSHQQTLHLLAEGRKQWVLYKYDALPASGMNPLQSLHHWLESSTEKEHQDAGVIHAIQEAGQFLYIPEGWYHASKTLSEVSVGVSFRSKHAQPNSYLRYLWEAEERVKSKDLLGAIRLYKLGLGINRNVLLLEKYADALVLNESFTLAEDVFRETLQLNVHNPVVYSKLINLMINFANRDISEEISQLLQQADKHGIRDEVLSLSHDRL